jgi:DNA-binding NarL/FixJ family response regulator
METQPSKHWSELPLPHSRQVVLVDNDPVTAALTAGAFRARVWDRLVHFDNAHRALAHLRDRHPETPVLILLAWSVPGSRAFLEALKADAALALIPVVILAESNEEPEVSAGFALGAAGCLIKSADPERLREDLAALCSYWALSELPRL